MEKQEGHKSLLEAANIEEKKTESSDIKIIKLTFDERYNDDCVDERYGCTCINYEKCCGCLLQ